MAIPLLSAVKQLRPQLLLISPRNAAPLSSGGAWGYLYFNAFFLSARARSTPQPISITPALRSVPAPQPSAPLHRFVADVTRRDLQ